MNNPNAAALITACKNGIARLASLLALMTLALAWGNAAAQTPTPAQQALPAIIQLLLSNEPPQVVITAPPAGAALPPSVPYSITADATDSDGTVTKVEFFVNGSLVSTATTAPYTGNWTPPSTGSYTLTARATDNDGDTTLSAPVTVTASTSALPAFTLNTPANGSTYGAPATIPLAITITTAGANGIKRVEYYRNSTLIASSTSAPNYSASDASVPAGSYTYMAKVIDNANLTVSATASVTVADVTLAAPTGTFVAPGVVALSATPSTATGLVKVNFYQGTTFIGSAGSSPYTYNWSSVPPGTYSITAEAVYLSKTVSSPASITVTGSGGGTPTAYYIYADHLDTPRVITDASAAVVWRWDNSEAFGNNAAINYGGSTLVVNLRFPGQYFDSETGLNYNYYRDYDPSIGRYVQSDPIGLSGGSWSTYSYVTNNPLSYVDSNGLMGQGSGIGTKIPGTTNIVRIDPPHVAGQQTHAHVYDKNGNLITAINVDGTGSHGQCPDDLPKNKKLAEYLLKKGFMLGVIGDVIFLRDLVNAVGQQTDPGNPWFYSDGSSGLEMN